MIQGFSGLGEALCDCHPRPHSFVDGSGRIVANPDTGHLMSVWPVTRQQSGDTRLAAGEHLAIGGGFIKRLERLDTDRISPVDALPGKQSCSRQGFRR